MRYLYFVFCLALLLVGCASQQEKVETLGDLGDVDIKIESDAEEKGGLFILGIERQ